ncbi:uncharacterized protein [Setaria viridis]|uniref:uncharacterized protein n=1 Tax=Setaria viridis TaxID=4556 RepID=UPI003B3B9B88
MLLHEVAAILNLHAQAVAVQNIRNLILIVLDVSSTNYACWHEQFLLMVGKFSLDAHIFQDRPLPGHPDSARMDCVIRSWIYGTLSNDLANTVMVLGTTARSVWLAVESQFHDNHETRALLLATQFRTFVQGDLSITNYCKRLKAMADALGELSELVIDQSLFLNVIRGLNTKYTAIGLHLRCGRPFSTFLEGCKDLLLEELTSTQPSSEHTTALLAAGSGTPTHSARPPQPQQQHRSGSGSFKPRRSKRNFGRRTSKDGNSCSGGGAGQCPPLPQWRQAGRLPGLLRCRPLALLLEPVDWGHPDVARCARSAGWGAPSCHVGPVLHAC